MTRLLPTVVALAASSASAQPCELKKKLNVDFVIVFDQKNYVSKVVLLLRNRIVFLILHSKVVQKINLKFRSRLGEGAVVSGSASLVASNAAADVEPKSTIGRYVTSEDLVNHEVDSFNAITTDVHPILLQEDGDWRARWKSCYWQLEKPTVHPDSAHCGDDDQAVNVLFGNDHWGGWKIGYEYLGDDDLCGAALNVGLEQIFNIFFMIKIVNFKVLPNSFVSFKFQVKSWLNSV